MRLAFSPAAPGESVATQPGPNQAGGHLEKQLIVQVGKTFVCQDLES